MTGLCTCGHRIYEHGRRVLPSSGGLQEYTGCRTPDCSCAKFGAADGSKWPEYDVAKNYEPVDLEAESEAWVGGQVLLEHQREPDIGTAT